VSPRVAEVHAYLVNERASAGPTLGASSTRSTRAATLGLAAVVLSLALFSIFSAYRTETLVDRATFQDTLDHAYRDANAAILGAEVSELEFLLDPSPGKRADFMAANSAIDEAISRIAAMGDQEDGRLADELLGLHLQYVAASARVVAAMSTGDIAEGHRVDHEEGDPFLNLMRARLTAATGLRAAAADDAFANLRETARWILLVAPIVFAIGFTLMAALWRVLGSYQRATRKTYDEIAQLSKLRGEFVSTVSHEFRTPLTGIQGFSEIMRDEELSIPEMREYAGDINKDARRLARLISDMLDLDRMESGLMTVSLVPVDLNRLLTEAAAQFRLDADDHPIELDLDQALPKVLGDPDGLTQVITNLLSNAIKYSPDGGAVEVRTERVATAVTLTVRDHGIGVPADQLERIFERYSRIETAATQNIQGTGLGLPIVRQLVQIYQGSVWATSSPGEGSVFHVRLPLPAASPALHAMQPLPHVQAA